MPSRVDNSDAANIERQLQWHYLQEARRELSAYLRGEPYSYQPLNWENLRPSPRFYEEDKIWK